MSAFLGPIHYWVFNKIKFQNEIVDNLVDFASGKNLDIALVLDKKYGKIEDAPLENIIDGSNIHGWLQQRVSQAEYRLATAIKLILDANIANDDELQNLFFEFGKQTGNEIKPTSAQEAYKMLGDLLLDGMPCDGVNEIEYEDDSTVSWRTTFCVHKKYWQEVGIDVSIYYLLRNNLVAGLLYGSDYDFIKNGAEYQIKKR